MKQGKKTIHDTHMEWNVKVFIRTIQTPKPHQIKIINLPREIIKYITSKRDDNKICFWQNNDGIWCIGHHPPTTEYICRSIQQNYQATAPPDFPVGEEITLLFKFDGSGVFYVHP